MKGVTLALLATMLAGCVQEPTDALSNEWKQIGRYQFISKETYPDGTVEYACLDTTNGLIGYATIYPDADQSRRNLTNFDCSN